MPHPDLFYILRSILIPVMYRSTVVTDYDTGGEVKFAPMPTAF